MPELLQDVLNHFVYWVDYWLLFNLCGVLIARLWLMPQSIRANPDLVQPWSRAWRILLILYCISGVIVSLADIAEICSVLLTFAPRQCISRIGGTYFATVWLLKASALVVLLLLSWRAFARHPSTRSLYCALLVIGVVCFSYSAISHAANQGIFTVLQVINWLHFLAVLVWSASILGFYSQLHPLLGPEFMSKRQAIEAVQRLSRVAVSAFFIALLSGGYMSWYLSNGLVTVLEHTYGQRLVIKVVFVAAMLLVSVRLRFYLMPQLNVKLVQDDEMMAIIGSIKNSIRVDRLLIAMVLLMTADVTHQIPPVELVYLPVSILP